MSERYTRIFEGTPDLYADGAPVIIKANVLLKDNTDGRIIAQLKYQNVSEKTVTFIKVVITPYDSMRSAIGQGETFEYLDLSAGQYEEFGSKNPLVLRERNARSYSVRVVGAAFADGSIWNDEGKEWRQDTEKAAFFRNDVIYKRAKSLFESASTENEFNTAAAMFQDISEFKDSDVLAKQCAEKAKVCNKNAVYSSAVSKMNENRLSGYEAAIAIFQSISGWKDADEQISTCQRKIEEIKAKEEAERLERERQAEQRRIAKEKTAKKRKKIAVIVTPIVVACIAFIIVLTTVIIPNGKYNSALDLYNAGKYDEAITAFKALNGYRDSEDQIKNCKTAIKDSKYNAAIELYNAGKYEEAYKAFNLLNYKDSADKAAESLLLRQKAGLTNVKAGSIIKFGFYEQDNNTSNGKEEIEWEVLTVEGNKALVISQHALACKPYNQTYTDTTWEKCTLRTWLNGTFYNAAFGSYHQKMIASSTVTADKNPLYSTSPGSNTTDKVFLLSINEVNKYFSSNDARKCAPTDYAIAQGAWTSDSYETGGKATCWWWLRSPGYYSDFAAFVYSDGSVSLDGPNVSNDDVAVRPAMWISLD